MIRHGRLLHASFPSQRITTDLGYYFCNEVFYGDLTNFGFAPRYF